MKAIYLTTDDPIYLPAFYDRDGSGIPHRWLQTVKQSIRTVLPRFSARRMVKEYVREMYVPAVTRSNLEGAKELGS